MDYTKTRQEIVDANSGCTMEELYDDAYQQGVEWMQRLMQPLIEKIVEYYNENDFEEISLDISKQDSDWCSRNCNNFNHECIARWLKAKQGQ